MRRYRRKRTTLAANELLSVRLVKCDCSAQFLQQIKGGQESFVLALFRELIAMFFRQRSTDLAHAGPKYCLPPGIATCYPRSVNRNIFYIIGVIVVIVIVLKVLHVF